MIGCLGNRCAPDQDASYENQAEQKKRAHAVILQGPLDLSRELWPHFLAGGGKRELPKRDKLGAHRFSPDRGVHDGKGNEGMADP